MSGSWAVITFAFSEFLEGCRLFSDSEEDGSDFITEVEILLISPVSFGGVNLTHNLDEVSFNVLDNSFSKGNGVLEDLGPG